MIEAEVTTAVKIVRYIEDKHKEGLLETLMNASSDDAAHLGVNGGSNANVIVKDDNYHVGFVAMIEDKIAGYAWCKFDSWSSRGALQQCYVVPEYRGRGVAHSLINARIKFIRERWNVTNGIYALTYSNPKMEDILQSFGFEYRGAWKDWIIIGNTAYDENLWVLP